MKRSLRKLAVTVNMDMLEAVRFIFSAKEQRWRWKWVSSEVGDSQMHSIYFLAMIQTTLSCALIRTFASEVMWYFSYVELLNYFETVHGLRSTRFRGVGEQRRSEKQDFRVLPARKMVLSPFFARENTKNPFLRSFFASKPHRNACYAGYWDSEHFILAIKHFVYWVYFDRFCRSLIKPFSIFTRGLSKFLYFRFCGSLLCYVELTR